MRIAVDVSIQETPYVTGVERVQRDLLKALARIDRDNEYLLVSRKPVDLGFELPPKWRLSSVVGDGVSYLWRERFAASLLDRQKIDVFHSPVSATPILGKAKKIATVHELPWVERNATALGRSEGGRIQRGHRVWLFLNVRYASRIVAVSERTRENILSLYPNSADKVVVIKNGVDARFAPIESPPPRGEFLARYRIPDRPYLLFVGTLRRKKNLRLLLEVFAKLPEPERSRAVLVLAGVRMPTWPEFDRLLKSRALENRVFLTGYVTDHDLNVLYHHARALVYPSLFEGFGLPPLEAMACGTPVVCSTGGAIPEVVGNAALTFAPDQPARLGDALLRILRDDELCASLRKKGFAHAKKFGWDDTARRYLDLYRELAAPAAPPPTRESAAGA